MTARRQIADLVSLWSKTKGNVDALADSLLVLLHRNGVTLDEHQNPTAKRIVDLTAERFALSTRIEAIDDELRDYGAQVERLGKSLVHPRSKPPPPPAPPPKRRIG